MVNEFMWQTVPQCHYVRNNTIVGMLLWENKQQQGGVV